MSKALYTLLFLTASLSTVFLFTTSYYYLAPLPGIMILFFLVIALRPEWGFYAIIFLVPFTAYTSLNANRLLSLPKFLGLILVVIIFFNALLKGANEVSLKSNLWRPLFLFAIASLISALFSPFFPTPLDEIRLLLSAYLVFAMALIFRTPEMFETEMPLVLILSLTISSLLSIYGYVFNSEMFAMDVTGESMKRGVGGVNNPNHFASMIIFSLPLVFHGIIHSATKPRRLLFLAAMVINVTAVVLTFSRSGALVLVAVLSLLVLEYYKKLRPRTVGLASAAVLAIALVIFVSVPTAYWERQQTVSRGDDRSVARRQSYLTVALSAFQEKPILGHGPGSFSLLYGSSEISRKFSGQGDGSRDAHNTYVEAAIGVGAVGLVLFIFLIVKALKNFGRAREIFKETGRNDLFHLAGAYRASFLSVLLYYFMLSRFTFKYFWLSLALSQAALALAQTLPTPKKEND
ncbi:MAG: O-antigen ligase family protein [Pseudomonadota bacterium]